MPGTVRGMALAHKKFGKLAWKDVVMPAAELARGVSDVGGSLARGLNSEVREGGPMRDVPGLGRRLSASPAAAHGRRAIGSCSRIWPGRLKAIADDGPDAFYTGWIADRIAEDMAANGGLITQSGSRRLPREGARAGQGHVLGYEIDLDAAAKLRRRRR